MSSIYFQSGFAVMIVLIPLNAVVTKNVATLEVRQMKTKDERVKLMNEILSGMKVLKLYAWEPSFEEQVQKIRRREIKTLRKIVYWNSVTEGIWTCAPFLV